MDRTTALSTSLGHEHAATIPKGGGLVPAFAGGFFNAVNRWGTRSEPYNLNPRAKANVDADFAVVKVLEESSSSALLLSA